MDPAKKRRFKTELYEQFARIGDAFSSPRRLEMIDLLAQSEWSVDELAGEMEMSSANTSRHLQILREAQLVNRRREGTYIYYSLADRRVYEAWKSVRELAESRLGDVRRVVEDYLSDRDELEEMTTAELAERLEQSGEDVLLLDVRPEREYREGHIPRARSLPVDELEDRLDELPEDREIVAYCRGPYCVFSDQAVEKLREAGFAARRLEEGLPDWTAEGHSVAKMN